MTHLSVNLNRVALLRNSRPLDIPNVVHAATLALEAGADGITLHPRPDQRHVRPADVHDVAALLRRWPAAEYNLEGNPLHQLMEHVVAVRPNQCTFVPDAADAATSDHGWDLERDGERLRPLIAQAHDCGARVSLFMDPIPEAMARARALGADRVELYTEPYARARRAAAGGVPRSLSRRRRSGVARRAGSQCRTRSEPAQPRRFPARGAGRARSVDRPCADRRRPRVRPRADRADVPGGDPTGICKSRSAFAGRRNRFPSRARGRGLG